MTEPRQGVDFEEARRIAERFTRTSFRGSPPFYPDPPDTTKLAAAYLALLARAEILDRDLEQADEEAEELLARAEDAEERRQEALRYLKSYCEAADPDPREDDGVEISIQDAYVLSAISTFAEHHPEAGE
jgi:hypothetical protein